MTIDSTALMYCAFQSCRHVMADASPTLALLVPVLAAVHRESTFLVEPGDGVEAAVRALDLYALAESEAKWTHGSALAPAHTHMLAVIDAGVRDLMRLTRVGPSEAVSALGYALHPLPKLLRTPEDLEPRMYAFCLGIAAKHWDQLSEQTHTAFSLLLGQDLTEAIVRGSRLPPTKP